MTGFHSVDPSAVVSGELLKLSRLHSTNCKEFSLETKYVSETNMEIRTCSKCGVEVL